MNIGFIHTQQYRPWNEELLATQVRRPVETMANVSIFDFVRDHREHLHDVEAECDRALSFVDAHAVDVCVYSSSWYDLPARFFRALRARGVRVVGIIWDTSIEPRPDELALFLNCDKILICDSVVNFTRYRALARAFKGAAADVGFAVGHLTDLGRFTGRSGPKRFDVSMLGSLEGDRIALAEVLRRHARDSGYTFNLGGGLTNEVQSSGRPRATGDWLDGDAYVDQINASKILLLSQTQRDRAQVKGKIFEFMACGGFCLVDHHLEYLAMIPDGAVAYYRSERELKQQIERYLKDEAGREAVAAAGGRWFRRTSDPVAFWTEVMTCAFKKRPLPDPILLAQSVTARGTDRVVGERLWSMMRDQIANGLRPPPRTRRILAWLRRPAAKIVRMARHLRA